MAYYNETENGGKYPWPVTIQPVHYLAHERFNKQVFEDYTIDFDPYRELDDEFYFGLYQQHLKNPFF